MARVCIGLRLVAYIHNCRYEWDLAGAYYVRVIVHNRIGCVAFEVGLNRFNYFMQAVLFGA